VTITAMKTSMAKQAAIIVVCVMLI